MPTHTLRESFEWNGRAVAWDRFGSGPDLVLLHGTPWSSALWRPIADALASRYTVHLWDMPGYGQSSMESEHTVDLGVQGALFAALLAHWRLDRPHVVAHDFGGAVALRARILHGVRYRSLCLVDVVALSPWGSPFFSLVRENATVFSQLPATVHRGAIEAYIRTASHRGLREDDLAMLAEPWTTPHGQAAFYRQIEQADERFTDEIESSYPTIDEPTHIVWGADDTWIPVDRAHRLHTMIPDSSTAILEGAGHLIQLDAPTALGVELARWLDAQG